jgi:hypothetical protein
MSDQDGLSQETRDTVLRVLEEWLDEFGSLSSYAEMTSRVLAAQAEVKQGEPEQGDWIAREACCPWCGGQSRQTPLRREGGVLCANPWHTEYQSDQPTTTEESRP